MNVRLAPRALSEAERLKTWWQKNRPASPNLFDEEMAIAIEQIQAAPRVGAVYPSSFGRTVRRLLMPKTKNHVYYLVRRCACATLLAMADCTSHGHLPGCSRREDATRSTTLSGHSPPLRK